MQPILYYIHDPMCSWCWAFRPVLQQIREQTAGQLEMRYLLGGLAVDTDQPMPAKMQAYLQEAWRTIQQRVPGTEFNFDFWSDCQPRRSTYPSCRAVIAARAQGAQFEAPMIYAIQQAYYLQARNPSDYATLAELAGQLGLDVAQFSTAIHAIETQQVLQQEMAQAKAMEVEGYPSLVLEYDGLRHHIGHNYLDPVPALKQIAAAGVAC